MISISRHLSTLVSVAVLVCLAAATAVGAQDATAGAACPAVKEILNKGYHDENKCNRKYFNEYKENLRRDLSYHSLKKEGGATRVPNQRTVTCPTEGEPVSNMIQTGNRQGYDTTWIVENTASTAVVLCWVNPVSGKEFSALDGSIAPPTADPRAILKPGEWRAVWTHEGHVFTAREINVETGEAGRIVMQHRTGLVPVGEGVKGLSCPETDVEPVVEVLAETGVKMLAPKFARTDPPAGAHQPQCNQIDIGFRPMGEGVTGLTCPNIDVEPVVKAAETGMRMMAPKFARTDPPAGVHQRDCNHIDIGFRNAANCPLHGYYIQPGAPLNSCPKEEFKLHLGVDPITPDFHKDWQSNTKFEGTAIGHSFAFRLASNPSILVETVTLEPTKVIDCPAQEETTEMQITADSIILPVRFRHHNGHKNATAETLLEYYEYANATSVANEEFKIERGASASRYGAASALSF
jgi:hypothetical protein